MIEVESHPYVQLLCLAHSLHLKHVGLCTSQLRLAPQFIIILVGVADHRVNFVLAIHLAGRSAEQRRYKQSSSKTVQRMNVDKSKNEAGSSF